MCDEHSSYGSDILLSGFAIGRLCVAPFYGKDREV